MKIKFSIHGSELFRVCHWGIIFETNSTFGTWPRLSVPQPDTGDWTAGPDWTQTHSYEMYAAWSCPHSYTQQDTSTDTGQISPTQNDIMIQILYNMSHQYPHTLVSIAETFTRNTFLFDCHSLFAWVWDSWIIHWLCIVWTLDIFYHGCFCPVSQCSLKLLSYCH